MDYADFVRSVNNAYWQTLLANDERAESAASDIAEQMGFEREAAREIIKKFSREPLSDWLAQRSAAAS